MTVALVFLADPDVIDEVLDKAIPKRHLQHIRRSHLLSTREFVMSKECDTITLSTVDSV
ncbi:MAG TPA: hypothetical protein V6D17_13215 [Candidatus Obscuribacterales bacterium]